MPSVTLKDVAKVAGVSYATVSRALSGSPEISEETRRRILKLCKEMGYTPNSVARSMVKRCTNVLGLIVPSLNNPFMSELTAHLEIYARTRGYNLMVCNSSYDYDLEKEVFSLLVGRQVDGIIMIPVGHESYEPLNALTSQVPTVFISENMKDYPENYVSVDNHRGMLPHSCLLQWLDGKAQCIAPAGRVSFNLREAEYRASRAAQQLHPQLPGGGLRHGR